MVTQIFSLWGFQTGWRSKQGNGYLVTATLDRVPVWYFAADIKTVERAFDRACRRTFFRRFLPWISPPPKELVLVSPAQEDLRLDE